MWRPRIKEKLSWKLTFSFTSTVSPSGKRKYALAAEWRSGKMGMVSGPTLGMPNLLAQFCPRLSGSRVIFRRFQPSRISLMVVGLMT